MHITSKNRERWKYWRQLDVRSLNAQVLLEWQAPTHTLFLYVNGQAQWCFHFSVSLLGLFPLLVSGCKILDQRNVFFISKT